MRAHILRFTVLFLALTGLCLYVSSTRGQTNGTPEDRNDDRDQLMQRALVPPISGLSAASLHDTFNERRGGGSSHEATDILAPRGTPVAAMDDGVIQRLFLSKPGGLTVYEFDGEGVFCFYYAHLDRYAEGLKEGMSVRRGDVIGYVGTTGNAPPDTPHLHLAIFRLGKEKRWWQGTPIDPYPILLKLVHPPAEL